MTDPRSSTAGSAAWLWAALRGVGPVSPTVRSRTTIQIFASSPQETPPVYVSADTGMPISPPTARPPVPRSPAAATNQRLRGRDLARVQLPAASREATPAPDHRARDWPFLRGLVVADLLAAGLGIGAA